jgi:hypothetical protein
MAAKQSIQDAVSLTPANPDVRRMVAAVSSKGGVGKTFTQSLLLDAYRTADADVVAYDADSKNRGLVRMHGSRGADGNLLEVQDLKTGVTPYDLTDKRGGQKFLDSVALEAKILQHDLPANPLKHLEDITDGGDGVQMLLDVLDDNNVHLTLLHVIDPGLDSAQSVGEYINTFGDRASHIAVLNLRECDGPVETVFRYWFGYAEKDGAKRYGKTRERLLAMGGAEIRLPALPSTTRSTIEAEKLTFAAARKSPLLTITEKAHVAKLIRDFGVAIEPVRPLLGF